MANQSNSHANLLETSQVAITNADNQNEIAAEMALFGYDEAVYSVGRGYLNAARQALDASLLERNEKSVAYAMFSTAKEELDKSYSLLRRKAKVVFRNNPIVLNALGLDREKPVAHVNWLEKIRRCCKSALADDNILAELSRLIATKEKIVSTLAKCDDLDGLRAKYLIEKGESQNATQIKDAPFKDLDNWMREFYAVAKIALEEQPQLLESLSIVVKS